ncbi:Sec-independent protein translocase subunit TatB [Wolbachia endosymbiont of Dirofilaria (Dirofilaria) immitis]|uniref:Sec-independent protein translocase subunit TatB n=1 Tax=Wolbachia endosymbiont of Dirofilaria (Dirofilaria) immitis TaxID=1812115 RepID=UPI001589C31E|nr:hypothetical protein [Wolbachia endosymbiont of Dirofilaria (Dirofilaria) immitis]QKX02358.1 hypothetical protein GOY12_02165 [Wolbachia endosymbiont of Dirofilaria (Dirofilaria) immitis]
MFNIGLPEILVVALVGVIVLDKNKVPVFISFIRDIYRYFVIVKSRIRSLLENAGIEDLCKEHNHEKVNYIVGKDGKFYPSYNIDNISKDNDSEDTGSR